MIGKELSKYLAIGWIETLDYLIKRVLVFFRQSHLPSPWLVDILTQLKTLIQLLDRRLLLLRETIFVGPNPFLRCALGDFDRKCA
jgi:hypothetical protein